MGALSSCLVKRDRDTDEERKEVFDKTHQYKFCSFLSSFMASSGLSNMDELFMWREPGPGQ